MEKSFPLHLLATCIALGATALACTAERDRPPLGFPLDDSAADDATGTLGLSLRVSNGAVVNAVDVEISGSQLSAPLRRTIPVDPDAATISARFGGLLQGGYSIAFHAESADGDTTCSGAANFTIIVGETVGVVVPLTCKTASDSGEVIIDVGLNVCPTLEFFFVAPLMAPVGSPIYVEAAFTDPDGDPISHAWTAEAGTFGDPSRPTTTYACEDAGVQTLTVTTNDGGDCEQATHLQVMCILTSFTACEPGEFQTVAPNQLQDRQCAPCVEGTFSTIQNAANCVPWTPCPAGEFIATPGSVIDNQTCAACPEGTFSSDEDWTACSPWSACAWGEIEVTPGTAGSNVQCGPGGEAFRQFGTTGVDGVSAIATALDGSVYVVGLTQGVLGDQAFGTLDAFVRKYDWMGDVVWTRQFGTTSVDDAAGVAVASDGSVYVAGSTSGSLDQASEGGTDSYLRKYDANGTLLWGRQFGTANSDNGYGVAVDAAGDVIISGATQGGLDGANIGGTDGYARKYDALGNIVWTRQYGTSSAEYPAGVAVDEQRNVYVAGETSGSLSGSNFGGQDGYVRKYSPVGVEVWTTQFGTSGQETVRGPTLDADGLVYIGGGTTGALDGTNAGSSDAFLRALDQDGVHLFTEQFGTSGFDTVYGLAAGGTSGVYVAGITNASLDGTIEGATDAFVRRYTSGGDLVWGSQFGTPSIDTALAAALDGSTSVFAGGSTDGALAGPSAGGTDAYVFKLPEP